MPERDRCRLGSDARRQRHRRQTQLSAGAATITNPLIRATRRDRLAFLREARLLADAVLFPVAGPSSTPIRKRSGGILPLRTLSSLEQTVPSGNLSSFERGGESSPPFHLSIRRENERRPVLVASRNPSANSGKSRS
ncbi:hypothetical protein MRX96_013965 [Rhipicephalus microplus]